MLSNISFCSNWFFYLVIGRYNYFKQTINTKKYYKKSIEQKIPLDSAIIIDYYVYEQKETHFKHKKEQSV